MSKITDGNYTSVIYTLVISLNILVLFYVLKKLFLLSYYAPIVNTMFVVFCGTD